MEPAGLPRREPSLYTVKALFILDSDGQRLLAKGGRRCPSCPPGQISGLLLGVPAVTPAPRSAVLRRHLPLAGGAGGIREERLQQSPAGGRRRRRAAGPHRRLPEQRRPLLLRGGELPGERARAGVGSQLPRGDPRPRAARGRGEALAAGQHGRGVPGGGRDRGRGGDPGERPAARGAEAEPPGGPGAGSLRLRPLGLPGG
ncbi:coatomer subunit zeta-2 isoform X2 [Struthio camelus]|uniref:coatomer subunit zeta-2 isoform X2 n=1 Tax=Struthio camelus TaxID=8801 RepID=UPI003603C8E2